MCHLERMQIVSIIVLSFSIFWLYDGMGRQCHYVASPSHHLSSHLSIGSWGVVPSMIKVFFQFSQLSLDMIFLSYSLNLVIHNRPIAAQ